MSNPSSLFLLNFTGLCLFVLGTTLKISNTQPMVDTTEVTALRSS